MLRHLRLWWQRKHLSWRIGQHHQSPRIGITSRSNHQHCSSLIPCWRNELRSILRNLRIQWRWKQLSIPRTTLWILRYSRTRSLRTRRIWKSCRKRWIKFLSCWSWSNDRLRRQRQRWCYQLWWIRQHRHQAIPKSMMMHIYTWIPLILT